MFGKSTRTNIDGFVIPRNNAHRTHSKGAVAPEQFLERPHLGADSQRNTNSLHPNPNAATNGRRTGEAPVVKTTNTRRHESLGEVLNKLPTTDLPPPSDTPKSTAAPRRRFYKPSKKIVKRVLIALGIIILLVGGYLGAKVFLAGGRIFEGNLFSALSNQPLKTDQYGNVNILMYGTAEDDPEHEGADLTDSIMVASINPTSKEGFLMSIPRDLWVKYGEACSAGYEGKINVVYQCGKGQTDNDAAGAEKLQAVIEENFGVDLNYYAQVNFTALEQAVDAVDGITVEIDSEDPRGILDRNFDWRCNYECNYVQWPNGPARLNGEQALALARARNAAGGYGLSAGNFDREQYQQKIIVALRDKAVSAGVLANPIRVAELMDSLGDNVRTNFEAAEIRTLVDLARETDASKLFRVNLAEEEDPLVTTENYLGQSIVQPAAGIYDFSQIKSMVRARLSGDTAMLEGAKVDVLNGSGIPGLASEKADELQEAGYSVGAVSNAPQDEYPTTLLYDLSDGKAPSTLAKLQEQFGITTALNTDDLPAGVVSSADFVIIIGTDGAN